ncbi:hypothetical protein R3P38DRAFT_3580614 [Favolaschia claudopus]|uniref:Uncharacterized protein n=1 Tax=Favolaschia claudopus TaxID=2862362 RepID=A0AAW0AKA3_9AGAR
MACELCEARANGEAIEVRRNHARAVRDKKQGIVGRRLRWCCCVAASRVELRQRTPALRFVSRITSTRTSGPEASAVFASVFSPLIRNSFVGPSLLSISFRFNHAQTNATYTIVSPPRLPRRRLAFDLHLSPPHLSYLLPASSPPLLLVYRSFLSLPSLLRSPKYTHLALLPASLHSLPLSLTLHTCPALDASSLKGMLCTSRATSRHYGRHNAPPVAFTLPTEITLEIFKHYLDALIIPWLASDLHLFDLHHAGHAGPLAPNHLPELPTTRRLDPPPKPLLAFESSVTR